MIKIRKFVQKKVIETILNHNALDSSRKFVYTYQKRVEKGMNENTTQTESNVSQMVEQLEICEIFNYVLLECPLVTHNAQEMYKFHSHLSTKSLISRMSQQNTQNRLRTCHDRAKQPQRRFRSNEEYKA